MDKHAAPRTATNCFRDISLAMISFSRLLINILFLSAYALMISLISTGFIGSLLVSGPSIVSATSVLLFFLLLVIAIIRIAS